MGRQEQRQCRHCGVRFAPERRNGHHQNYCGALPCKAASKKASQAKWLAKNRDYHRGPEAVARVQAWRRAHPGYSRGQSAAPLQEALPFGTVANTPTLSEVLAPPKNSCNAQEELATTPLQDFLSAQPIVLVGLIAHIWDSALQEDIATVVTQLIQLGHDIRGGGHEHCETTLDPGTPAADSRAFQLDRSSTGTRAHHREG